MNHTCYPPRRTLLLALTLALALPGLQGCFGVAVAGATAGALAATDRRSIGTQTEDEGIELKASNRLSDQIAVKVHINTTSFGRRVLLTGEVPDEATRAKAEEVVTAVENVQGVWNELLVGPTSSFSARSNDTYITSKVKARFIDANQFSANHVKVVTEAAVVFLLGVVTDREAKAAVQVARSTQGVKKVVNLLHIISEQEAKRVDININNTPPASSSSDNTSE